MTSKLTRDRLAEIAQFGFSSAITPANDFEIKELARMALAAMDSESWCLPLDYLQGHKDGLEWAAQLAEANHPETGDWLYDDPIELAKAIRKGPDMPTAQPAPVVPDGLRLALSNAGIAAPESDEMLAATCEKHIQALVTWVKDRKPFQSAPVVPTFDEWLEISGNKPLGWVKDAMRESYDACRADMLAAAPHDTPTLNSVQSVVTAQGKWIPVSERIPEDRKQVILWDAEIGEVTSGHYSHKTQTFYHCGDAIENEITHWMPPPCAPQEVK